MLSSVHKLGNWIWLKWDTELRSATMQTWCGVRNFYWNLRKKDKIHLYNGIWSNKMGLEHEVSFSEHSNLWLNTSSCCSVAVHSGQPSRSTVIEFKSTKWFSAIMIWSTNEREKYSDRNSRRAGFILKTVFLIIKIRRPSEKSYGNIQGKQ